MKVCKFGGSCLTSKQALQNIKKLCQKNNSRNVLVFSAVGKYKGDDTKLTDLLISFTQADNSSRKKIYKLIYKKFNMLCRNTKSKIDLKKELSSLLHSSRQDASFIISRGEYLTTKIMAEFLNIRFVPAEKILFFNDNEVDYSKTRTHLLRQLKKHKKIAVPGFYGIDSLKNIKLFSRGGGDVSGAVIAKSINGDVYENWTDVCGIKEVNPMFFNTPTIQKMSYTDLEMMTSMDAKVVHEDVAKILKNISTKLQVASIFFPNKEKTIVSKKTRQQIKYISYSSRDGVNNLFINVNGKVTIINGIKNDCLPIVVKKYYDLLLC